MHEKIAEFDETAKAGPSNEELDARQLVFTQETKGKDETYLTALRQGKQHLKAMMPKIQAMEIQHMSWNKQKIFANKFSHKI
jgi:hypothetical protein